MLAHLFFDKELRISPVQRTSQRAEIREAGTESSPKPGPLWKIPKRAQGHFDVEPGG